MKDHRPYSDNWGEIIHFVDGWCYGIAPDGKTVCCGKEQEVKAILADPSKRSENPLINEILDLERKLREEQKDEGNDTTGIQTTHIKARRTGNFRARPTIHTKHK